MQETIAQTVYSLSFYVLALIAVVSALIVIIQRNPIISAIWLMVSFVCVAGIYVLLQAHFLAMVQILVYAGAVMVLFVMVVMLMDLKELGEAERRQRWIRFFGALSGILIMLWLLILTSQAWKVSWKPKPILGTGTTERIGEVLFTRYLLHFEILSLVILSAVIAVIYLARRWEDKG